MDTIRKYWTAGVLWTWVYCSGFTVWLAICQLQWSYGHLPISECGLYASRRFGAAAKWDKRSMRDLTGWTVVVIGATDGVGYDAAKAFAEHNAHIIVVGRNPDKTRL